MLQRKAQRTSFQCYLVYCTPAPLKRDLHGFCVRISETSHTNFFLMLVLWSLNKHGLLQVTKYHAADASGVVEQQAADRLWEQEAILDSFFKLFNRQVSAGWLGFLHLSWTCCVWYRRKGKHPNSRPLLPPVLLIHTDALFLIVFTSTFSNCCQWLFPWPWSGQPQLSQREGRGPASCPEAFTPQRPKDPWHMQPATRLRELPSDCRGSGRPHGRGPRHPQMARVGGRGRELGPGAAVRSRAQLLLTPPSAALSARQHGPKQCATAKRQAGLKSGDRSVWGAGRASLSLDAPQPWSLGSPGASTRRLKSHPAQSQHQAPVSGSGCRQEADF